MKITCQSCNSKYNVADEKVQGKTVKIRCRKCGATIVVHGTTAPTANGSAPAPETTAPVRAEEAQWHVNVADNDQRTMSLAELVKAYQTGIVTVDTFVWTDGMDDWKTVSEVEAVVGASRTPNATAGSTAAATAAQNDARSPAQAVPGYQAPSGPDNGYQAPKATGAVPPEAAGPSFGSPFADEPVAAAAAEPRRAAVMKREARARDLFGTNVGEDMQTNAEAAAALLAPPAQLEDGKLTGQRNENSVLFSLEVLTKSAEQRAPQTLVGSTKDDSGIIDLKALAAKAESMRPAALAQPDAFSGPLATASAPFAPFGGMGPSAPDIGPKSRLPLLIGGGAGIALLLVLGIVIGLRLGGTSSGSPPAGATMSPPTPASTTETIAAPTAAAAEPAATATTPAQALGATPGAGAGAAGAKPHAAAGAGAGVHVSAGGTAKPPAAGGGAAVAGGAAATAGGGAAAAPAPPKKGDCNCNGDLMCLMKCSTSGK